MSQSKIPILAFSSSFCPVNVARFARNDECDLFCEFQLPFFYLQGDANGQYWLGAIRDETDPKSWQWINGEEVTVSFWNLPGGNENCARFDGTKGWLWSDTNCGLKLNFICQHRKYT